MFIRLVFLCVKYLNELGMWEVFTDAESKKRGPIVYMQLRGKAKEAVRSLTPDELHVDDGLKLIIDKLDAIFLKVKNTRAFHAFQKFYEYRCESGDTFETFIVRYENLYSKLSSIPDMKLPDGVQAFFLLMAANLPEEMEKLTRATVTKTTYQDMKLQIKKIFGGIAEGEKSHVPAKDEVLMTGSHEEVAEDTVIIEDIIMQEVEEIPEER